MELSLHKPPQSLYYNYYYYHTPCMYVYIYIFFSHRLLTHLFIFAPVQTGLQRPITRVFLSGVTGAF